LEQVEQAVQTQEELVALILYLIQLHLLAVVLVVV